MTTLISITFTIVGSLVGGFALFKLLHRIEPGKVSDYRPCKGEFWESKLNNCASGLKSVPQQPINTYTNIVYLTGGLFLMFELNNLPTYIFFLATLYLFAASSLFHATSTGWGGHLDVSAMYALFSTMLIYAASSLIMLDESVVALAMFIAASLSGYLLVRKYYKYIIPVLVLLVYIFLILSKLQNNTSPLMDTFMIISFVLYLMGVASWILDKKGWFPLKRWGHAFWHFFSASAIFLLYYSVYLTQ
jgi:predicted membrane channel-forming protein YqfA (hemolysin III family)